MKSVLAGLFVVIVFIVFAAAAYYIVPAMVDKGTSGLRSEVQNLTQRVQKIEEEAKAAPLPPDADVRNIIQAVNSLSLKITSLDGSFKQEMSATHEAMRKQSAETGEGIKKQTEAIDKMGKETQMAIQKLKFDAIMASIRGHILKVRVDLVTKNIGTAKNEFELIHEVFDKAKASASEENKKAIEEFQSSLRKAKTEIDADLPSAINRIDLVWYELGKLLRRG
jgi:hypothetical protein